MRELKEIKRGVIIVFLSNLDNTIPGAGDIKLNKTQHLLS